MGLDQYLIAKFWFSDWAENKAQYKEIISIIGLKDEKVCQSTPSLTVNVKIGYWRKANQIHKWFVDNVQNGVDNNEDVMVQREQLEHLLTICNEILSTKGKKKMQKKAAELLPTSSGFFFGSTDIDDWYFDDIKSTVQQLTDILNNPKFAEVEFYYRASW